MDPGISESMRTKILSIRFLIRLFILDSNLMIGSDLDRRRPEASEHFLEKLI
jgi:hypothetical protein